MATIATTTHATPLQYPSNQHLDRDPRTGFLYALVKATTANTYEIYRSENNGGTWALDATFTRASVVEVGSIVIDNTGNLSICYRTNESSQDRIYFRRLGELWEAEVLLSAAANGGVAGAVSTGLDHQVVNTGTSSVTQWVLVVAGYNAGGVRGVTLHGAKASPGAAPVANNGIVSGPRQYTPETGTGRLTPSLDLESTGDGKSATVPNLWLCFGRTSLYTMRIAWNGSGWSTPTSPLTIVATMTAEDFTAGRFDGERFLMAIPHQSGPTTVALYERNKAHTATVARQTTAHPDGNVRVCSLSYNAISRDTRVFAVGTSTNDLYYTDFIRLTATWSGWTVVTTTDILGAGVDNWNVRRTSYGNNRYDAYTAHTGNTLVHTQLSLAYAPLVPTWVFSAVPYTNGGAADTAASLLLDWAFNDPDPLDTQGSYALSRQVGAGSLEYWRVSDGTWQVAEVQNTSAVTQLTLTATQWSTDGAAGGPTDPAHTYRVKTWDAAAVASAYSVGLVLVPSVKVNPTIATPVDAGVVAVDTVTTTWTVAEQTAYQVQLWIFTEMLWDSGKVVSSATTVTAPTTLVNGFNYSVKLWTWNNEGLQSDVDQNNFLVSFVAPNAPSHVATALPALGYISVAITNPFTAATFVSAGTASHDANAAGASTVTPGLPASMATGDTMLVLDAIRNSGTGVPVLPTDYTTLLIYGNVGLFGKTHDGSETAPVCSFTGGVANATVSAQMCAFRNARLSIVGQSTILNGSAANIIFSSLVSPGSNIVMVVIGWRQQDWTSVAVPAGFTEIGEPASGLGDNQGLYWAYRLDTVPTDVTGSSLVVTGGVAGISRGIVVALSGIPNVAGNDVFRLETGAPLEEGVRVGRDVPVGGTVNDFRAPARTDWSYRVLALGENGSSATGPWAP